MKFIDEAVIEIKAGAGGNGCVSFRREKYVPKGGPDGGDGGNGGAVYFVGNPNMSTLLDYKYRQHWASGRGEHGRGKNQHGKNGEDLVVPVPLGTEIIDAETDKTLADVTEADTRVCILTAAKGGRGNTRFTSPTHQAPLEFEPGRPVRTLRVKLSLKVIADVGIVGYPNAGKSTLIAKISQARPKIADYPFTTLAPNLGMVRVSDDTSFVVADIPGIIEGAHEGVGLGIQFLKHVERTKLLIHLVDGDPYNNRNPLDDYTTLNRELSSYSQQLAEKDQIVAVSKMDIPGAREKLPLLSGHLDIDIFPISAKNGEGVAALLFEAARRITEIRNRQTPQDSGAKGE